MGQIQKDVIPKSALSIQQIRSKLSWLDCVSATALVAGTTVGAGVLALPSVTFSAGLWPSSVLLLLIWGYTLLSGFLIAEVHLRGRQHFQQDSIGLLGLTQGYLGSTWANGVTLVFLFLHYALLVAYVSEGGSLLKFLLDRMGTPIIFSEKVGIITFVVLLGSVIGLGSRRWVNRLNSLLVTGVLFSFVGLMGAIASHFDLPQHLLVNWRAATPAIPVMLVAMFYHNVIPVIIEQLSGDAYKIRWSLVLGSLIPLLMFLAWNGMVLCTVGESALAVGLDPLDVLQTQVGGGAINGWIRSFSLLAIATSFIGVSYGLRNIWQDVWRPDVSNDVGQQVSINTLVFAPPIGLCSLNPDLFIAALSYAGTFSVATLYGFLPALLAWQSRSVESTDLTEPWIPGGQWTLTAMMAIAMVLMLLGLM